MIRMHTLVKTDTDDFEPVTETEYRHWHPTVIEGAVIFEVDDREVWGTEFWDDVADFWPYMVMVARDCREKGEGEIGFPDQPLRLGMRMVAPGFLEVRVWIWKAEELSRVVVFADDFWAALRDGFDEFIEHADRLGIPTDGYRRLRVQMKDW